MLGDLVAVCLRATSMTTTVPVVSRKAVGTASAYTTPLRLTTTRTLLLLRNLALAPSTGQVLVCCGTVLVQRTPLVYDPFVEAVVKRGRIQRACLLPALSDKLSRYNGGFVACKRHPRTLHTNYVRFVGVNPCLRVRGSAMRPPCLRVEQITRCYASAVHAVSTAVSKSPSSHSRCPTVLHTKVQPRRQPKQTIVQGDTPAYRMCLPRRR